MVNCPVTASVLEFAAMAWELGGSGWGDTGLYGALGFAAALGASGAGVF